MIQKIHATQPVHDRAFDLGEMQRDAAVTQALVDAFKRFQGAAVDGVDRRAQQDDVLDVRAGRHALEDQRFEMAGIGEVKAFVDP